jgi:uncharacterized tellurite resistance protein B-like protein
MTWTPAQRRTLLNLWCRVARADGVIDDSEVERLSELFHELGQGVVESSELERWLEEGPPEPEGKLPAEAMPMFHERARTIMAADREIVLSESTTLRELTEKWFER